jgi:hypothetical protein
MFIIQCIMQKEMFALMLSWTLYDMVHLGYTTRSVCMSNKTKILSTYWTLRFDIATTGRTTTRRLAWIISDRTTRRQCDVWRFVVLSLATTRRSKAFQSSLHSGHIHIKDVKVFVRSSPNSVKIFCFNVIVDKFEYG